MLLMVMPRYDSTQKLPIRQTGMEMTVTNVARNVCRKNSISSEQRITAWMMSLPTPFMERRMKSDLL